MWIRWWLFWGDDTYKTQEKNTKKSEIKALLLKENEKKEKMFFRQVLEGRVVQVGALRGQEGANGARWGRISLRKSIQAVQLLTVLIV